MPETECPTCGRVGTCRECCCVDPVHKGRGPDRVCRVCLHGGPAGTCAYGHDFEHVVDGSGELTRVLCRGCGRSWSVVRYGSPPRDGWPPDLQTKTTETDDA